MCLDRNIHHIISAFNVEREVQNQTNLFSPSLFPLFFLYTLLLSASCLTFITCLTSYPVSPVPTLSCFTVLLECRLTPSPVSPILFVSPPSPYCPLSPVSLLLVFQFVFITSLMSLLCPTYLTCLTSTVSPLSPPKTYTSLSRLSPISLLLSLIKAVSFIQCC